MNEDFQTSWSEPATMQHTDSNVTARQSNVAPQKQIVTIRLDVEMLKWFKAAGPGYQTRINQILRDHMEASKAAQEGN